jgi:undecaprenyl-diphosphatase
MSVSAAILRLDRRLAQRIHGLSGKPLWDRFFFWISRLGDGYMYVAAYLLLYVFHRRGFTSILTASAVGFLVNLLLYKALKHGVKRPRPFQDGIDVISLIRPPDEFSFPSGHTAAAAAFGVFFSALFPPAWPALSLLALAVGLSRIYNGVHYPGDVLAGLGLGTGCAFTCLSVLS